MKTFKKTKKVVEHIETLTTIRCDVCKRVSQEHGAGYTQEKFFDLEHRGYYDPRDGGVDSEYIDCCSNKDCVKEAIKEWAEQEIEKYDGDTRKMVISSGLLKIIASIIDNK